jgi:hypothetical protein
MQQSQGTGTEVSSIHCSPTSSFNIIFFLVFRWKASQHNLVGQIQTRDTLLDQCRNLRLVYEQMAENYKSQFPGSKVSAYEALTAAKSKSGLAPAETLLRAANFTYMKKPSSNEYCGTFYPHVRAFCLKSKKIWEQFERLMTAYQKAEIPHPFMIHAIEAMNKLFKEGKKGAKILKSRVAAILKQFK